MALLNKFEYNILETIRKHPNLNSEEISKRCKEPYQIIENRMSPLKRKLYIEIGYNENLCKETYKISTEGLQALADYKADKNSSFWEKFEDRFWKFAPLVISIISLLKSYNII